MVILCAWLAMQSAELDRLIEELRSENSLTLKKAPARNERAPFPIRLIRVQFVYNPS